MRDRIESLSEQQRNCLRLVGRGMSSKEIAQRVGLTPQTVDTYLKAAIAKLDAVNRRDAARILVDYEASQDLGSPTPAIAPPAVIPEPSPATDGGWRDRFLPPPVGGRQNELSTTQRSVAVLKVAALALVIVIAMILAIAGLFYTLR